MPLFGPPSYGCRTMTRGAKAPTDPSSAKIRISRITTCSFFGVTDADLNFEFSWTRSRHSTASYEIVPTRAPPVNGRHKVRFCSRDCPSCTFRTRSDVLPSRPVKATRRHPQPLPFRPRLLANAADCPRLSTFARQCPVHGGFRCAAARSFSPVRNLVIVSLGLLVEPQLNSSQVSIFCPLILLFLHILLAGEQWHQASAFRLIFHPPSPVQPPRSAINLRSAQAPLENAWRRIKPIGETSPCSTFKMLFVPISTIIALLSLGHLSDAALTPRAPAGQTINLIRSQQSKSWSKDQWGSWAQNQKAALEAKYRSPGSQVQRRATGTN